MKFNEIKVGQLIGTKRDNKPVGLRVTKLDGRSVETKEVKTSAPIYFRFEKDEVPDWNLVEQAPESGTTTGSK